MRKTSRDNFDWEALWEGNSPVNPPDKAEFWQWVRNDFQPPNAHFEFWMITKNIPPWRVKLLLKNILSKKEGKESSNGEEDNEYTASEKVYELRELKENILKHLDCRKGVQLCSASDRADEICRDHVNKKCFQKSFDPIVTITRQCHFLPNYDMGTAYEWAQNYDWLKNEDVRFPLITGSTTTDALTNVAKTMLFYNNIMEENLLKNDKSFKVSEILVDTFPKELSALDKRLIYAFSIEMSALQVTRKMNDQMHFKKATVKIDFSFVLRYEGTPVKKFWSLLVSASKPNIFEKLHDRLPRGHREPFSFFERVARCQDSQTQDSYRVNFLQPFFRFGFDRILWTLFRHFQTLHIDSEDWASIETPVDDPILWKTLENHDFRRDGPAVIPHLFTMTSKLERLPLEDFLIDSTELGMRTKELLVKRRNAYEEERVKMFRTPNLTEKFYELWHFTETAVGKTNLGLKRSVTWIPVFPDDARPYLHSVYTL